MSRTRITFCSWESAYTQSQVVTPRLYVSALWKFGAALERLAADRTPE